MWILSKALMSNYENSLCSPELVEESSQGNYLDGEQCARSNGTPQLVLYSQCDKMMDHCQRSQSGLTCRPLKGSRGEGVLMWFREGFLAKTSASPTVKQKESRGRDQPCDPTWLESSVKLCRKSFSWKTHRNLWEEDLDELSLIFPKWGTLRDGVVWEGIPQEVLRMERGSGLSLMRPTFTDGKRQAFKVKSLIRKNHGDGNLSEQVARLFNKRITPTTCEVLMRFPIGWTALQPLETHKTQSWQERHLEH